MFSWMLFYAVSICKINYLTLSMMNLGSCCCHLILQISKFNFCSHTVDFACRVLDLIQLSFQPIHSASCEIHLQSINQIEFGWSIILCLQTWGLTYCLFSLKVLQSTYLTIINMAIFAFKWNPLPCLKLHPSNVQYYIYLPLLGTPHL